MTRQFEGAKNRERLDHPIFDADGHTVEFWPALAGYIEDEGIRLDPERPLTELGVLPDWSRLSPDERVRRRAVRPPWWTFPAENTLDLATATLPKLLHERLDEMGIDLSVIYPSLGLVFMHLENEEYRRASCRALNRYHADIFRSYADRLIPVAVIPMQTPGEALAELDHAVGELGFKAIVLASYAKRSVEALAAEPRSLEYASWMDSFGIDSPYDYDPIWKRCLELGVSVATHSAGMGWGSRRSISSYVYNHIGNFASAGEALCKSLFLGGVTRRFPRLPFAFLEGGVAWAAALYADLIGHWEKRNGQAVQRYDPERLDRPEFERLLEQYGAELTVRVSPSAGTPGLSGEVSYAQVAALDEFAACRIERVEDIRELFVESFYFGCEGDDPLVPIAYDTKLNPLGARLNALYGSDLGHWDVPDMKNVLAEAYELVDTGRLGAEDFRRFAFEAPSRFYLETNPRFLEGTILESQAGALLASAD